MVELGQIIRCAQRRLEIPLLLWTNTTIGLLEYWWSGSRQQIGRTRLTNSTLPGLKVLDVETLSTKRLKLAHEIFEKFKKRRFLPANEAWRDKTRKDLDFVVLVELLELPPSAISDNFDWLRRQWCEEPTVHGGRTLLLFKCITELKCT